MSVLQFLKLIVIICSPVLAMAVLLRAAVAIANRVIRLDGATDTIKTPSFGWSLLVMAIAIVPCLGSFSFVLPAMDPPDAGDVSLSILIGTPVSVLITGGILSLMLSTTYSRGVGVAACLVACLWTVVGAAIVTAKVLAA